MKKIAFFILLILVARSTYAQKSDYVWLSGYDSKTYIDSAIFGYRYGNTIINFNEFPVNIGYDSLAINLDADNLTFSDTSGDLLFSTNAVYVFNSINEKIKYSDSLNNGYIENVFDPSILEDGYRYPQGILAFEAANQKSLFYIIYSYADTVDGTQANAIYCPKILTALLDMKANSGHGEMIYKNKTLIDDNLGVELTATKHGNGRDWWLLVQRRNTNCYYRILIDSTGPHTLTDIICSDSIISDNDIGSVTFSPDGNKYACFTVIGGLKIFDFDRCSGELSNPVHIAINIWRDSSWLGNGLAISPNNRFLYLSATHYLVQYDLQAADIFSSADTVGIYDGYYVGTPAGRSLFNTEQMTPEGKIYISCGNTLPVYHVINNPDEKGVACNFVQHGVRLPTLSAGVPNFPNYRLGRSVGSACDTLWNSNDEIKINEREKILKVFPNPATDIITVDYGFTDWSKAGEVSLEIVNELGQIFYTQKLPQYSGFQKIDVSRFSTGMYTAYIKRNEMVVAVQKFGVAH